MRFICVLAHFGLSGYINYHLSKESAEKTSYFALLCQHTKAIEKFSDALIPATTALSTLSPDGHLQGILSGANVIMPNLSPQNVGALYNIYDNKAYKASQSADELQLLDNELHSIGYYINYSRGDHKNFSGNDNNL